MKGENKASEKGRDVKTGHQPQRVQNIEKVGSTGTGIKFPVPNHHDHSNVGGGGAVKTPEC